ncbi:hypothetical protein QTG54_005024 [Skeletonema marinoi]|uniref:Potassium channel domain-containing protein n=1 Tax=Skeletonema marinoi TaxID=267567 RepID=A0AAD9DEA2_9STRA|nr:hypothetical protein QTG54_005024 [Skeletonema marinoi]
MFPTLIRPIKKRKLKCMDGEPTGALLQLCRRRSCRRQGTYVARYDALEKSFADANGFDDEDCFPNMWAGSWFWFTIMTTIGYGNTAPATDGGRIMIFTLGFVSILFFGFVLGKAGSIVVAIVEDSF